MDVEDPQTYDLLPEIQTDVPPTETLEVNFVPTIPTNGVEGFAGWITGTSIEASDATINVIDEPFFTEVNWYNRKFMGIVDKIDDPLDPDDDHGGPVFFFGSVNDDGTIAYAKVIGSDSSWCDVEQMEIPTRIIGSGTAGQFVNLDNNFTFGFDSSGYAKDLYYQSTQETWNISGSGSSLGTDSIDSTAPTGSAYWNGFVTGFAENITYPDMNRRLFMNSDNSDFYMDIDRDTGTVYGGFTASDGTAPTLSVSIGGDNGSAYIVDDNIVALLDGTVTNGGTNDLMTDSNFLHSGDPDKAKPATYVQWGYWNAAYIDPSTTYVYDVHYPGSLWIAGVPTSASGGTFPTSATYTYSGMAYGAKISTAGTDPVQGTTSLLITLTSGGAGSIDSGSVINAGDLSLGLTGTINSGGVFNINTGFTGADTATVNGALFGPNAESVAGNFTATTISPDTATYIGIFGGDR